MCTTLVLLYGKRNKPFERARATVTRRPLIKIEVSFKVEIRQIVIAR